MKTKIYSKAFASDSKQSKPNKHSENSKLDYPQLPLFKSQLEIWQGEIFNELTPAQRAGLAAEHQLCFGA